MDKRFLGSSPKDRFVKKLLIANRGEIAIRIADAAAALGIPTAGIAPEDDRSSAHVRAVDEFYPLAGSGVGAYLDAEQIVRLARTAGCDALAPGYGFLSENAEFARRCDDAGLRFVGPAPETLELFGDKVRARAFATGAGVAVLRGTSGRTDLAAAQAFFASLDDGAAVMVKALAGGGGRGMRAVFRREDLASAYDRCASEARIAFGDDALFVEALVLAARHVEVQIAGDGSGRVVHLYERECTLQRRNGKLIEIAPAPNLDSALRERIVRAAVRLAERAAYRSLGTFEFLVNVSNGEPGANGHNENGTFAFIEANPRLQVEHTVTEEALGIDLVRAQLLLADGASLEDAGLDSAAIGPPRLFALQARINAETIGADGAPRPSAGTLETFDFPSGAGIRVDTYGYAGYALNPRFDSLLAKLVVRASSLDADELFRKARRALAEVRIEGIGTNVAFLAAILAHPDVAAGRATTRFVDEHAAEFAPAPVPPDGGEFQAMFGERIVAAPMQGRLVSVDVRAGDVVRPGAQLAVIEAMKMEHVVVAGIAGIVQRIAVASDATVAAGDALVILEPIAPDGVAPAADAAVDLTAIRSDLAEVLERQQRTTDAARPGAVARRRATGQRTARENVEALCDNGTFVEYGALLLPAQKQRRSLDDLIAHYPADGLVAGVGDVNGAQFSEERTRTLVLAYDYTVFAGTQGFLNHKKTDRMLGIAERYRLPIVLFAEGGGGRPGDTDQAVVAGLDVMTFASFARLSGRVPRVGIVSGRSFAGNAALLGACDVIIATANATVGMGGPAMIEGGGLGSYAPEAVGPLAIQVPNGVVDVAVADEREAVDVAQRYLSYFQGRIPRWTCADQRLLRTLIPENRLRAYDVRGVLESLSDERSLLELRGGFAAGMVTALARVEGRPLGIIANDPRHLAGAIDSNGADKASRFMALCDAFSLPVLFLCDTPGIMVGPDAERTGTVRHAARMFVTAGSLRVPFFTIVLRKGYGLGAQAMAGGSFAAGAFTVSWPSGEFGAMGLEGAVRLGYRRELEAVPDPAQRQALFERMVAEQYERGKALNMATILEIDDVIDPADSRRWIVHGLRLAGRDRDEPPRRERMVDTW